jgi:pSer/pThr/pTyr-binding forkhead associated (FHA) protein
MRLLGRTGQLSGRTVAVSGPLKIGRAPENGLQLSIDGVSRQHAQVTPDGDGFWIEDLNSANGTFLNGVRVTKERLAHLDVITLGRVADLIVDARSVAAPAVGAVSGDVFLELLDGAESGTRVAVPAGELTIGRAAPSNFLIDSRVVSKLHARLRRTTDRLALDDLDSPNGTFVNGARITTNRVLHDSDTISIAGVRSFRVHLSGGAPAPGPAAMPAAPLAAASPAAAPPAAFSQEWKTKLVWSADELSAVEAERARVIEEVRRSTGGLPGDGGGAAPSPAAPPASAPAPARKTEFIGRGSTPLPPDFAAAGAPPSGAVSASVPPPARKTEFLDRGSVPMPPDFGPPAAPAAAPPAPAPPPVPAPVPAPAPAPTPAPTPAPAPAPAPKTSFFRPGTDLPPVFAEAPPAASNAPGAAGAPMPATSTFRPGADLPPLLSDAPTPPRTPMPVAAPDVFCLRGTAGEFTLTEGTHVVGRQEGVAIVISDRQVSRNHAAITVQNGRVTIEDRASANGTFVNGERLTSPRTLKAGDQLKFGDVQLVLIVKK